MSAIAKLQTDTAIDIIARVEENPALAIIEPERFDELYAELEREVRATVPDLSTASGRERIGSMAYKISRRKTAIDAAGKELTEAKRKEIGAIDAVRKSIRDRMDTLRDEARQPLTDWEAAEEVRVARVRRDLDELKSAGVVQVDDTIADLETRVASVEAMEITAETFKDYFEIAVERRTAAVDALRFGIARLQREEADRQELDRLRAEAAERQRAEDARLAAEREEQARQEQERAEAERLRREEERRQEAEAAEQRRVAEAAERARAEAEERHAAELRALEERHAAEARERERAEEVRRLTAEREERERREAEEARQRDQAHRAKVFFEAQAAIVTAAKVSEAKAKEIVSAIAAGSIPNVSIQF